MGKVTTPETMGELNKKLVLDYVRKNGPISRADIKRKLGMSFPSVSAYVKSLLEINYLKEVGEGDNSLGRKSTLLAYNAARGYIIGVDLGRSQIRVMITDLLGREIASTNRDSSTKSRKKHEIAKQLKLTIFQAIKEGDIDILKVKCIVIGVPGVIDNHTGDILIAPFFQDINKNDLIHELTPDFSIPIIVGKAVTHGAIGEKWRGIANGYKNIIYIDYGVGIGAGIIINGEIYTGFNGMAGEVGFMVLDRANIRKNFEDQGVLETMISGNQISQALSNSGLGEDIGVLMERYDKGDEPSKVLIDELVDYVGMFLINMATMLNPELIVLSGGLGSLFDSSLIGKWEQMLTAHVPCAPKLAASKLASRANVLGAVAVGLRHINEYIEETV